MFVTIIRHAEKELGDYYNPHLRHQDEPITRQGQLDAQKLLSFFDQQPIAAIYVSAYLRTLQTITPFAQERGLTPSVDERLNEIDNGVFDGLSETEIARAYPTEWKAFLERKTDFRFPNGETGQEAQKRMTDFLEEKRQLHTNDHIFVVAHDGLIRLLMCFVVGIPVYKRWSFQVAFCGITQISYEQSHQSWKLIRFNQQLLW